MKTPEVRPELAQLPPDTDISAHEPIPPDEADRTRRWARPLLVAGASALTLSVVLGPNSAADSPTPVETAQYHPQPHHSSNAKPSPADHLRSAASRLDIPKHANIVEIMVDDADKKVMRPWIEPNIFKYVVDRGVSLSRDRVQEALCCTSRATSLTGEYAQNTRVIGNDYPAGGYTAFHRYDEKRALPTWLKAKGYVTAFLGKYFNGYPFPPGHRKDGISNSTVPTGWSSWDAPIEGDPYAGFSDRLNVNGHVDKHMRHRFITDILSKYADKTLRSIPKGKHFYLTLRPFTPHFPFTYPRRFANLYNNLREPRTADFNESNVQDKMRPYSHMAPLTTAEVARADADYRDRARGMRAVDQSFGKLYNLIKRRHQLHNTYFIVTSDNGEEIGEHRMLETKYDQFDQSEAVPYFVSGPGIPHGKKMHILAGNVDWAPTIADMAGIPIPASADGVSLLPELTGRAAVNPQQVARFKRRSFMLIGRGAVPRYTKAPNGMIEPTEGSVDTKTQAWKRDFVGVVSNSGLKLVLFTRGGGKRWEVYNDRADPSEVNNLSRHFGKLPERIKRQVWQMERVLPELLSCSGVSCDISANDVPTTPLSGAEKRNLKQWLKSALWQDITLRPGSSPRGSGGG